MLQGGRLHQNLHEGPEHARFAGGKVDSIVFIHHDSVKADALGRFRCQGGLQDTDRRWCQIQNNKVGARKILDGVLQFKGYRSELHYYAFTMRLPCTGSS